MNVRACPSIAETSQTQNDGFETDISRISPGASKGSLTMTSPIATTWTNVARASRRACRTTGTLSMVVGVWAVLCATSAYAESFWNHNGSTVWLSSDGVNRELKYFEPRLGLPVRRDTVLFRGSANGSTYSGTAYVFSAVCGATGYRVSGAAVAARRSIILNGQAPRLDATCNVIGYRNDVLVFNFINCGCDCGDEPELVAMYPSFAENTNQGEGTSCPYLYAWNDRNSGWDSYGKVIHEARGPTREMTQVIKLSTFATKFRLSEEESPSTRSSTKSNYTFSSRMDRRLSSNPQRRIS